MDIDKILEEYRAGDDGKRLSLFMAYRELREHFERIEAESDHEDLTLFRFPWSRRDRLARAA